VLLKRSVSPLRNVEDRRRYVHGAFMLHILAHTRLFMCTYVYVNQIRLFCHIIGGLKLFPNILGHSTFEDRFLQALGFSDT